MDDIFVARMKERLIQLRRVAAAAHDRRIVKLVTQTADELEEDINQLEADKSKTVTIHLEPPNT